MKINDFIPNTQIYSKFNSIEDKKETINENGNVSFGETLKNKLEEVNEKQLEAEKTTEQFIKGDNVDIHEVMVKTEEAKLSLQLAVQVRNKLLEAYQEINRMQV
ncbi:flagellar hook-basal body complex protein FliE [Clostridium bovifaecis]|uniref:Flagellar hook-basal body complex protein FliE n=1 Tax=Clostridium bovifaecis TaxID=2184719 RepID=A0A6I6EN41_9CLOT|nr:flagellar hook-basal body complex protein FliE [Clostridium bovifaecis]